VTVATSMLTNIAKLKDGVPHIPVHSQQRPLDCIIILIIVEVVSSSSSSSNSSRPSSSSS